MISDNPVFHQSNNTANKKKDDGDMYCTVGEVKSKYLPSLSPDKLIRMWGIGLKNLIKTLDATTNQCIRYTEILSKRFKHGKA